MTAKDVLLLSWVPAGLLPLGQNVNFKVPISLIFLSLKVEPFSNTKFQKLNRFLRSCSSLTCKLDSFGTAVVFDRAFIPL